MHIWGARSNVLWGVVGAIVALVLSVTAVKSPLLAGLLLGPLLAVAIFSRRPKAGFVIWLLTVAFIPCWVGINAGSFVPATLAGSAIGLTSLLVGTKWRPGKADLSVVILLVVAALGVYFGSSSGGSSMSGLVSMLMLWLPGYLVGRFVCERAGISFVKTAVAVTFTAVGALALIEQFFSWHPFVGATGESTLAKIWAPIQARGGVERSEWAFGHSIALGGSLALAIPFLLTSSLKTRNKLICLALILGGVAATLSRGAMLAAGLTLLLTLVTTGNLKRAHKAMLFVASGVLGVFVFSEFTEVSENAGSEVTDSSSYRVSMLVRLLPTLEPFGRSTSFLSGLNGQVQYGQYRSIDNAFLALGLGFGWIAMIVAILPFIVMAVRFLRRKASFAEVALLGQLPVITTVAMITQYQVVVWMVAGLAATLAATKPSVPAPEGNRQHAVTVSSTQ